MNSQPYNSQHKTAPIDTERLNTRLGPVAWRSSGQGLPLVFFAGAVASTAAVVSITWSTMPATVAEWLPVLAQTLGAKQPMRVPRFIGRLFAGEAGVVMMTDVRGASNAKAKRGLAWAPRHSSWRQGFAAA